MEETKGLGRASYIWGRSVHNTRIERLWYDVTAGFGAKWKKFFQDLEANHGLNRSRPGHIWLLHHLFLEQVDQDAKEWASAWNSHRVRFSPRDQHPRSPREMFMFGMVQEGPRGIQRFLVPPDEALPAEDVAGYGVDWEVRDDPAYMEHLLANNPHEQEEDNPFSAATTPASLSEVVCDDPRCPLTVGQVNFLNVQLRERFDITTRNMHARRMLWIDALSLAETIHSSM
ncbi:hypothetical protein PLICRDRAFT_112141 [Plicaturopsis crispa FD-325 SS-3]|nr:hypothetical protein PLICRDRAFT_112141 [Plicaturopsis crispa FD-325 SS-3]